MIPCAHRGRLLLCLLAMLSALLLAACNRKEKAPAPPDNPATKEGEAKSADQPAARDGKFVDLALASDKPGPMGPGGYGPSAPMQDGNIATNGGPGRVDEKRLREQWGSLPASERAKVTKELARKVDRVVKADKIETELKDAKPAANKPAPAGGEAKPGDTTPETGTEQYDLIKENPFKLVTQDPLSTFSSDVDTASYSNMRRFLTQENRLPPKDAVRVEEMINYFTYDYAAPENEHPVAIHPELTTCPWNPKHKLLRIGVQSKKMNPKEMPPRNFVFLVDSSGSMGPENRLPLLKKSLGMLIDQLTDKDRVAIVTYAGESRLVMDATPGDQREKIREAVNSLQSGGGIVLAYEIAQKNFIPGGLNRVILGTDGDFNVGVTDDGSLVRMIEEKRKGGVFLTILGYGMGNLKDSRMEKLAHHGNGHYAYIDSEREAHKMFVEQGAALVTVAKDVKFQVEFNPKHIAGYRLVGYENRLMAHQDFNDDTKDAGDMGSGHSVTVLYELVPAGENVAVPGIDPLKYQKTEPTKASETDEWLTIKLRYKDPMQETSKLLSVPIKGADLRKDPSPDCEFATAVAAFGMLLRDSQHRGNMTFSAIAEIAAAGVGADPGGHRAEFVKLARMADGMKK